MQRNLQTAGPLLRKLGCTAALRTDIMESGAIIHQSDKPVFNELVNAGEAGDRAKAIHLLKTTKWLPSGLSWEDIRTRFPWAKPDHEFAGDLTGPWYRLGFETDKAAVRRVGRVHEW